MHKHREPLFASEGVEMDTECLIGRRTEREKDGEKRVVSPRIWVNILLSLA
jgi:hypothetical protein